MTMVAVGNAVKTVGATPVYVDCMPGGINPGPAEYLARATPKVRWGGARELGNSMRPRYEQDTGNCSEA